MAEYTSVSVRVLVQIEVVALSTTTADRWREVRRWSGLEQRGRSDQLGPGWAETDDGDPWRRRGSARETTLPRAGSQRP